jgi:hypothetical protein
MYPQAIAGTNRIIAYKYSFPGIAVASVARHSWSDNSLRRDKILQAKDRQTRSNSRGRQNAQNHLTGPSRAPALGRPAGLAVQYSLGLLSERRPRFDPAGSPGTRDRKKDLMAWT